jgi:hypothetical protein
MLMRLLALVCGTLVSACASAQSVADDPGRHADDPTPALYPSGGPGPRSLAPVHFQSTPQTILVADLGPEFDIAAISEVAVADLDRDGFRDIVVAWFATDVQNTASNLRFITIFYGDGRGGFVRGNDFNLYIRNVANQQRSIFANGTAAMALGDFDADGDLDIAVTAYFGDEIWFIENLGTRAYTPRYKHVFGIDSPGNLITPPEAVVGDFDGDGRTDLAYLIDPTARINFTTIVFWQTPSTMANVARRTWSGVDLGVPVSYTRGLAVADLNGDGRADLCFSGVQSLGQEIPPAIAVFWYGLNVGSQQFNATYETLNSISSDVVNVTHPSLCNPTMVFSDRDGMSIESWNSTCAGGVDYALTTTESGFSGAFDRGMALVSADLNGDGFPDLVARQKSGAVTNCHRVEIALGVPGATDWVRLPADTLSTCGFFDTATNGILRPRNLAVADMFWNSEPEIIAGFGPTPSGTGLGRLEVAIWPNSCRGDINHDGATDVADLTVLLGSIACVGHNGYNAEADLDRSGCVDMGDLTILLSDFGCSCCEN